VGDEAGGIANGRDGGRDGVAVQFHDGGGGRTGLPDGGRR
jgi:hypothetical protein